MNEVAFMGHQGALDDLIGHVKTCITRLEQIFDKVVEIIGVEPRRMNGQRARYVLDAADVDPVMERFSSRNGYGTIAPPGQSRHQR